MHKLTLSKRDCLEQIAKLRELCAKQDTYPLSEIELRGRFVSILNTNGEPRTYFVTKTFSNKTTQVMDIDTGQVTTIYIHELYVNGKVFVIPIWR